MLPGRNFLILLGVLFVGGCAVPVPVQVASWAIDGISYLTTQKSLTDHGLSFVAQKDCALWRGIQGKNICDSYDDDAGTVAVAAAAPPDDAVDTQESSQNLENTVEIADAEEMVAFDTASGDGQEQVAMAEEPVAGEPVAEEPMVEETAPVVAEPVVGEVIDSVATGPVEPVGEILPPTVGSTPAPASVPMPALAPPVTVAAVAQVEGEEYAAGAAPTGERILIPGRRSWSDKPGANIYYVIGSFQNRNNAKRLVKKHKVLGPSVMASRVRGVETYRVAVGPFTRVEQRSVEWTIRKTGIHDSWAISIDLSRWMVAGASAPRKVPVADVKPPVEETASLPVDVIQNITKTIKDIDNKQINAPINIGNNHQEEVGAEAGQNSPYDAAAVDRNREPRGGGPGKPADRGGGNGSLPVISRDQIGRIVELA